MNTRQTTSLLRRRQLDKQLTTGAALGRPTRPARGWIREIREALGMTASQLARRTGIAQPTVANLEQSEVADTITLKSLKKMAEAMDCSLVYALVPNESLEATLRRQARRRAAQLVGRVEHTMLLEAQGQGAAEKELEEQDLAEELARTLSRELWEGGDAA